MRRGDFLITPNWAWHDHGNEGTDAVMWLDGLGVPLIAEQDAVSFEKYTWVHGREMQLVSRADDSLKRWRRRTSTPTHAGRRCPT